MYSFRTRCGPVDLAFTDRSGGVSGPPFESLNLAIEGEDPAGARAENLRLLLADFAPGARLADLRQVHGKDVVVAQGPVEQATADGLVTDRPDLVLLVRAADCVPVLLADVDAGVVGAAHSGRGGVVANVVGATVRRMRDLGAERIRAWVGPHVCGACYEVPVELRAEVTAVEPVAWATTAWGTPAVDLGSGVRSQLEREGVLVEEVGRCTREDPALYSYRRDGARAGRLAGLIKVSS